MSPSKFYNDHAKREINNGTRPSPLKINKDSHLIQKSSPSSSSNSSSSLTTGIIANKQLPPAHQHQHQQRHPVIIYTHSPKIIHTKARDFMALVQKLTGLSHSEDEAHVSRLEGKGNMIGGGGHDDNSSSSVVTDENSSSGGGGITDVHGNYSSSSISQPAFDHPPNPYLSDVPLFTPNSSDFFCSASRPPYYRYPANASMMGVIKGYPDYCN